jgi:hypothetical protein
MLSATAQYARVILFQCPQCRGPLASASSFSNADMQTLEGGQFSAVCRCGWMGNGLDLSGVIESVQPWEAVAETPPRDEFVHAYSLNPRDWLFRVAKEIAAFSHKALALKGS